MNSDDTLSTSGSKSITMGVTLIGTQEETQNLRVPAATKVRQKEQDRLEPEEFTIEEEETDVQIAQLLDILRIEDERKDALGRIINLYNSKLDEMENLTEGARGSLTPFEKHLPTIRRLSKCCPHKDVCAAFAVLIERLSTSGLLNIVPMPEIPPSGYIPKENTRDVHTDDEEVRSEFLEAFRADGRVSHMTLVMGSHPRYLKKFRETHNAMLWDDGPLEMTTRHMIAILAAGRHQCRYLLRIHSKTFLSLGGDPKWLESHEHLPTKLRNLLPLNSILAHQPWILRAEDIGALIKSGVDGWSLNELMQALVIMTHFHALASFTMGCGINHDMDFIEYHVPDTRTIDKRTSDEDVTTTTTAAATTTPSTTTPTSTSTPTMPTPTPTATPTTTSTTASSTTTSLLNTTTLTDSQRGQTSTTPPSSSSASRSSSPSHSPLPSLLSSSSIQPPLYPDGHVDNTPLINSESATLDNDTTTTNDKGLPHQLTTTTTTTTTPTLSTMPVTTTMTSTASISTSVSTSTTSTNATSSSSSTMTDISSVIDRLRNPAQLQDDSESEDSKDADALNFDNAVKADDTVSKTQEQQTDIHAVAYPLCLHTLSFGSSTQYIHGHVDFDVRSKSYTMLRTQEFSWSDQCFSTLNRYYVDIAQLIDEEFHEIKELTYGCMGEESNVDTFKFRWAIWNYVLRIKGIVNDEYMYQEVNKFLSRSVKTYIKSVVCYPQLCSKSQWREFIGDEIQDSERVHINLLAMAARKQAELLHGTLAITNFMSSRE